MADAPEIIVIGGPSAVLELAKLRQDVADKGIVVKRKEITMDSGDNFREILEEEMLALEDIKEPMTPREHHVHESILKAQFKQMTKKQAHRYNKRPFHHRGGRR